MRRIKAPAAARGKWSCTLLLEQGRATAVAGVEKVPDGDSRHLMAKIRDGIDERCPVVARRVWLQCDTEPMRRIPYVSVVTIAI